jgi:hypothetical protein
MEPKANGNNAMFHVQKTFARFSKKFFALARLTRWVIYGTPSNEFKQATADLHPIYMTPFNGFTR